MLSSHFRQLPNIAKLRPGLFSIKIYGETIIINVAKPQPGELPLLAVATCHKMNTTMMVMFIMNKVGPSVLFKELPFPRRTLMATVLGMLATLIQMVMESRLKKTTAQLFPMLSKLMKTVRENPV